MLFDKLWAQVKEAEETGKLTVEEALDCATRLPQALFCSMMECLAEKGADPKSWSFRRRASTSMSSLVWNRSLQA